MSEQKPVDLTAIHRRLDNYGERLNRLDELVKPGLGMEQAIEAAKEQANKAHQFAIKVGSELNRFHKEFLDWAQFIERMSDDLAALESRAGLNTRVCSKCSRQLRTATGKCSFCGTQGARLTTNG